MSYIVAFKHLKGNHVQERFGLAKEKSGYRIRLILVLYIYILIASRAVKKKKNQLTLQVAKPWSFLAFLSWKTVSGRKVDSTVFSTSPNILSVILSLVAASG